MEGLERISELFEQLNVDRICEEIKREHLREFLNTWKAQMGREIDEKVGEIPDLIKEISEKVSEEVRLETIEKYSLALMDILHRKHREAQTPVIHPSEIFKVDERLKEGDGE